MKVRMDNTVTGNNKSPTFLSQLIGINGFQVTNTAIGYRGYPGDSFHFNWPVAIDSCSTSHENNGCGNDFCDVTSRPPSKPCTLVPAQDDSAEVVCLEFSNTADQNACWTNYDPKNTSKKIVAGGGFDGPVEVGDPIDVTNGDESSAVKEMYDKFYGQGSYNPNNRAGSHQYGPTPDQINSWVIKLPLIECQTGLHCAGSAPAKVVGGACFEVREIDAPAGGGGGGGRGGGGGGDRLIKGRFLCPTSSSQKVRDLFNRYCAAPGQSDPGGCNGGIHVQRPVLVQ
ncbi:MAG: hypothetical protein E6J87_24190 [Deltaproteobacteria bacterium]|nr:MAG: hypothetical protein E6J87_24190 [Deltaproteobacteria bacterium]